MSETSLLLGYLLPPLCHSIEFCFDFLNFLKILLIFRTPTLNWKGDRILILYFVFSTTFDYQSTLHAVENQNSLLNNFHYSSLKIIFNTFFVLFVQWP